MKTTSAAEATRLAVKAAYRLARDTKAPILVAIFDIDHEGKSTIVVSTQPDTPGDAQRMVQILHDTMAEPNKIAHSCVCGDPNCKSLQHLRTTFSES